MTPLHALAVVAAGAAAGTVNTIVGSGSLITFPTLLALGYPPVLANVSNTVGLVPGSLSGVVAYRRELSGQARRVAVLGVAALAGGLAGAVLLLASPGSVFRQVVPYLILLACALMVLQPQLALAVGRRRGRTRSGPVVLVLAVFATAVYGGYFGAAQGVIQLALLAVFVDDDLQRLNATKNVLALTANAVAAVVFATVHHVAWAAAGLLAIGAVAGGQVGGHAGRCLPAAVLRAVVVVAGVLSAAVLLAHGL